MMPRESPKSGAKKYVERLTELALQTFFTALSAQLQDHLRPRLSGWIQEVYAQLNEKQKKTLRSITSVPASRAPPAVVAQLRFVLGIHGLIAWTRVHRRQTFDELGAEASQQLIRNWLADQPKAFQIEVLEAGIRSLANQARAIDQELIHKSLGQLLSSKEEKVTTSTAPTFVFDPRGLPSDFNQGLFETRVENVLESGIGLPSTDTVAIAAIKGLLLLDEQFDPNAFGFNDAIQKEWLEFQGQSKFLDTSGANPTTTTTFNRKYYEAIENIIPTLSGSSNQISYQEFSFVGRFVIKGSDSIPLGSQFFSTQVRLGLDNFVAGNAPFDSLQLPPLTGADGSDIEIEPDNVKAVSLMYAAYQLEQLRLFQVVDRITEVFMNGMLPIGLDEGGKALDAYYWNRMNRMNEAERHSVYSRVLGAPGGDVSKEVQPNTTFNELFMRFLSSLAEYDQQQHITGLFTPQRGSLALSDVAVRKAGGDLAGNASLYGWGYTNFAARRLNQDITTAIGIINLPPIQKAYGVTNFWQVVERVAANEFGHAPNIVKYRTMAVAGKEILDLVAKYAKVWSNTTGNSLFRDPNNQDSGFDISPVDQAELIRQAQLWLAVNGIKDDQVSQYSQPAESTLAPSVPYMPGMTGGGGSSNGTFDEIRQMVSKGQTPSLDQLQKLLPKVGV